MKITRPPTPQISSKTRVVKFVGKTTVLPAAHIVEIWHSQEVKLSANWQSAGSTYGIKLFVKDNEEAIQAGIKRAEEIVEESLVEKIKQQQELLQSLKRE